MSQQGTDEHFQSYLSNWLWHYDCNDSAKYHFQIQLLSNWKFWYLSVLLWGATKKKQKIRVLFRIGFDVITTMILYLSILPHKGTKKKCWMSQQITEEHFEHVLSSFCMLISVCAFKLVYVVSWLVALVVHNVSLASLVPFSSHYYINNSPLSSTYGDMTTILTVCRVLPLTINGSPHEQVAKRGDK